MGALCRIGSAKAIWQNNYVIAQLLLMQMLCELTLCTLPSPLLLSVVQRFCCL